MIGQRPIRNSNRSKSGIETSVIMPVRNGAPFIRDAIASVLSQLGPQDELIVVDDASTDETLSIVSEARDERILVVPARLRGVSGARNAGLDIARGRFIAFLDHDDLWPAGRHKIMMQALLERPEVDAVFGRVRIQFEPDVTPTDGYLVLDGKHLRTGSVCCALYRRAMLEKIGGFAEDMSFGEDADYNSRLRDAGMRSELCDVDALVYRRHAFNKTRDRTGVRQGVFETLRRKLSRIRSESPT